MPDARCKRFASDCHGLPVQQSEPLRKIVPFKHSIRSDEGGTLTDLHGA